MHIVSSRRDVLRSVAALSATGLSAPFVATSAFAATAQFSLKLVYPDTPAHPFMQVALRFAEAVKKMTDGAVEVQVFTTGQLGSQMNMLTSLQTGIIDLCAHTSGFLQTIYQPAMVMDLPFLFPDEATAEKVLDGAAGKQILESLSAKGIYGLSYGHFGWRVLSTVDRAAPTPEGAKSLKVRVQPGAIFVATFKQLQAIPVAIDLSEVYLALSQRAIDAVETPMISVAASKHEEVVKVINLTRHVYNPGIMMASKRKMDALPKPFQEAIRAASTAMTADWRSTIATATRTIQTSFAEKGLKIVDVDRAAYRKAVDPVYAQFRDTIGSDLMDTVLKQVG
jgi:tripartite ATP-independent transporter DctP family solute receptor